MVVWGWDLHGRQIYWKYINFPVRGRSSQVRKNMQSCDLFKKIVIKESSEIWKISSELKHPDISNSIPWCSAVVQPELKSPTTTKLWIPEDRTRVKTCKIVWKQKKKLIYSAEFICKSHLHKWINPGFLTPELRNETKQCNTTVATCRHPTFTFRASSSPSHTRRAQPSKPATKGQKRQLLAHRRLGAKVPNAKTEAKE